MAIKPIQILINAKDDASAVFDKLQTKIAAVGVAILGYFGVQAFSGMVKGAADFQAAMSRVQAATGASVEEMKELRKTAQNVGSTSAFSAVQAAGALENLAKSGLNAADAIKVLPAVMNLAQAGDVDLATSAEYVTKAINGLGLSFNDAGRVADVLAKGANATNTSVTGLAQALSYAAPLANSLGLGLEQTVAIIGKFADAGIDASRAGTALNAVMAQFADPASKFRTELAGAGITTSDFSTALHQLAKAGPIGQRAINAVGTEAGPALRALLNQGIEKLDELTISLKESQGAARATAQVMNDNLKKAAERLGGAWDYVKDTLGAPVLPVLQAGVEKLAGALNSVVADGTIAKFGQAIATGLQGAIEWVTKFAASFDWNATTARLQAFATQAQDTFDQVGQWAKNAGNTVQLAYGVMSAGVNTVLAAVYKIAEAFSGVSRDVTLGIAALNEALAKVTFGGMAENFRKEAAEMREVAAGLTGVTEAFAKKSEEAAAQAAASAELARKGWDGLTESTAASAKAAARSEGAFAALATTLQATAEANALMADKARVATAELERQAEAAQKAMIAQDDLRAEYAKAVATGNWQRAAEAMVKLRAATQGAGDAANATAKDIEAAFMRMGVQTKDSLRIVAEVAKRDFELIRDSGQASADAIAAAWSKSADAAIAANDGVVPYWVQGEAAAKGYQIQVDEAGKATLQLVQTSAALKGLAGGFDSAAAAAGRYGKSLSGQRTGSPGGSGGRGGGGRSDGDGFDQDEQNRRDGYSRQNVFKVDHNAARDAELAASAAASTADREKRLGGQNAVDASLQFELRDKLKAGQLTEADVGDLQAVIGSLKQNNALNGSASKLSAGFQSTLGASDALSWQQTMKQFEQAVQRFSTRGQGDTHVTNITLPGGGRHSLNFADEESSASAQELIRQLAGGRATYQ